jgi:hypothetical protein
MKTLSFSKDRVRVLVSAELGSVVGGQGAAQATATAVSSAFNGGGAQATATAVSSAFNGGGAQATATAVSSAAPVVHKHHHHKVSSAKPTATAVSSALPNGGLVSSALPV